MKLFLAIALLIGSTVPVFANGVAFSTYISQNNNWLNLRYPAPPNPLMNETGAYYPEGWGRPNYYLTFGTLIPYTVIPSLMPIDFTYTLRIGQDYASTQYLSWTGCIFPSGCWANLAFIGLPVELTPVMSSFELIGVNQQWQINSDGVYDFPFQTVLYPELSAPVPEPGTLVLAGSGLLGIFAFVRKLS